MSLHKNNSTPQSPFGNSKVPLYDAVANLSRYGSWKKGAQSMTYSNETPPKTAGFINLRYNVDVYVRNLFGQVHYSPARIRPCKYSKPKVGDCQAQLDPELGEQLTFRPQWQNPHYARLLFNWKMKQGLDAIPTNKYPTI